MNQFAYQTFFSYCSSWLLICAILLRLTVEDALSLSLLMESSNRCVIYNKPSDSDLQLLENICWAEYIIVCHTHWHHSRVINKLMFCKRKNLKQSDLQYLIIQWLLIAVAHDGSACRLCLQAVTACWFWLRGSTKRWTTAPCSPAMTSQTEEFPSSQTISTESTAWCCGRPCTGALISY